ncbi:hypothetical protein Tco_0562489 [Tanacetum coccineum]
MEQELRLKREAAERAFEAQAEKDRTLMRLEELRFLATSTKDLDDDDAYWIKKNSFASLYEEDMVFEDVGNSNAGNDGYVVTDATKVGEDSDSNVDDLLTETAQYMASPTKQASGSGGASEASFREDEDYNMYGGYKDYAYDLTEQHKAFCQEWILIY